MEAIIGVTYRCNAKCYMCNTWKFPSKNEDEIRPEIITKLPPNLKFANITGGEPFIRQDLSEIVDIVKKKTKRLVISTNGFFTERITSVAKDHSDIGFRISIEGLPRSNDELRGIKDGFDKGLRTLLGLKAIGIKDIGFGITVSDRNAKDLMELYQLAKAMNLEFATAVTHNSYYFHKYDNKFENKELIIGEFKKLVKELLKSSRPKNWFRAYFNDGITDFIEGKTRRLPCEVGRDVFYLDPYGEIRPCNGMEESMGNLKEKSFEEIWNSNKASEVREKVEICDKNCWMIGSVSPAMKKRIWIPIKWILQNKWNYN